MSFAGSLCQPGPDALLGSHLILLMRARSIARGLYGQTAQTTPVLF